LALEPLEVDAVIALVEAQLALGRLGEARRPAPATLRHADRPARAAGAATRAHR
jgi:hypothetical protein